MKLAIKMDKPIHDIHPKEWNKQVNTEALDYVPFRSLQHFKTYVSKVTQKEDMKCGISYKDALRDLQQGNSNLSDNKYESIRNLVRSKLLKRKLITNDLYEEYKLAPEGLVIDMQKLVDGDPSCMLSHNGTGESFFYEIYVSISYPYHVSNETVQENTIKLLTVIEELQRKHIFIKVTLVFADRKPNSENDMLMVIPLFSHKDYKDIKTMSSVINDRLLRKFTFALLEDVYDNNLRSDYGSAVQLDNVINIGDDLDYEELMIKIIKEVGCE